MRTRVPSAVAIFALALTLAGCRMWAEKPVKQWQQATGGEQLVRLMWQELKARNFTELESHMAATWVWLTPAGPLDRAATLAHMKQVEIRDYTLGDFQVRPNGTDVVVTYTVVVHGSASGQPLPTAPMRMMTVWQQAKHGWTAIAHAEAR